MCLYIEQWLTGRNAGEPHSLREEEMKMWKGLAAIAVLSLSGCASVPTASDSETNAILSMTAPAEGTAGLFVYRDSYFGAALKKDIWINGECIGESAPGTFFYHEVEGGKSYVLSTESEFSPNDLNLSVESGKFYFVRQYIKMGVFVGGAGLEPMDENAGWAAVRKLSLAEKGQCSASR